MKFKLPSLFPSKSKKKLRATAVRKPLRIAATADYDEMAEPNMKLSRALLIVLLLHVVAVSGIIAFNAIKTRQATTASINRANSSATEKAEKAETASHSAGVAKEVANTHTDNAKGAHAATKVAGKEDHKTDHAKPSASDSGKTYVVAKNDTPVTIAKKFKISYDELLAVNHIDDPHKLQIGQKLIIPAKPTKPKKSE